MKEENTLALLTKCVKSGRMRGFLSCVFPCDHNNLGMIRLIHLNGRVEELGTPIQVAQLLKTYPNHFVVQASYPPPRIHHVHPHSFLQLGQIYILLPAARRSFTIYLSKSALQQDTLLSRSANNKVYVSKEYFTRLESIEKNKVMEKKTKKKRVEAQQQQKQEKQQEMSVDRRSGIASSRHSHRKSSWQPSLESILETP